MLPYLIVFRVGIALLLGVYETQWHLGLARDAVRLVGVVVMGSLLFASLLFVLQLPSFPRTVVVLEGILSLFFFVLTRMGVRALGEVTSLEWGSREGRRTIIAGSSDGVHTVFRALRNRSGPGYQVIGFADDDPNAHKSLVGGVRVLGPASRIVALARLYGAEHVIFTFPYLDEAQLSGLVRGVLAADLTAEVAHLEVMGGAGLAAPASLHPTPGRSLPNRDPVTSRGARTVPGLAVLGGGTALAALLGLGFQSVMAFWFGAGSETDAFFMSLSIFGFLAKFLMLTHLKSLALPPYTRLRATDQAGAKEFAGGLLGISVVAVAVLSFLLFFASPLLVDALAPGYEGTTRDLTILLLRIRVPALPFLAGTTVAMALLESERRFGVTISAQKVAPAAVSLLLLLALADRFRDRSSGMDRAGVHGGRRARDLGCGSLPRRLGRPASSGEEPGTAPDRRPLG